MQVLPRFLLYPVFRVLKKRIVGAFNDEGPPVPIPNTEVKLISAEDTCLATDWKNRSVPTLIKGQKAFYASLAQ